MLFYRQNFQNSLPVVRKLRCFCFDMDVRYTKFMILKVKCILLVIPLLILMGCAPSSSTKNGTLQGKVTVGPLSPVEQVGVPTSVPPAEVYTSRGIQINRAGSDKAFKQLNFFSDGTYSIDLPPGEYTVTLQNTGMDRSPELPANITIQSDEITLLNISIDTGIR